MSGISFVKPLTTPTYAGTCSPIEQIGDRVLLTRYDIVGGVTAVALSDPRFSLSKYRRLLFQLRNLEWYYVNSGTLTFNLMLNGQSIYANLPYYSVNLTTGSAITQIAYGESYAPSLLGVNALTDANHSIPVLDLNMSRKLATISVDDFSGLVNASVYRPILAGIAYPSAGLTFGDLDFHGWLLTLTGGSVFTGGTVHVYGELL